LTLFDSIFRQGRQHDDDHAAILPHHLKTQGNIGGLKSSPINNGRALMKDESMQHELIQEESIQLALIQ
jgi:hypothetical protein